MGARHLLFALLLVAASALSGWYHWQSGDESAAVASAEGRVVDSTLSHFTATVYGEDGRMRHRLEADHLLRYAGSEEAWLTRPRFTLASDQGPPWRVDAPWGYWQPDAEDERLWLQDAVRVRRAAFADQDDLGIDTRDLHFFLARELAETDASAVLRNGTAHLRGDGMTIDLASENVRLLANVRGFYRDLEY